MVDSPTRVCSNLERCRINDPQASGSVTSFEGGRQPLGKSSWRDFQYNILKSHFGRQLDNSEKVQCCMRVHVPDTVPKGEPHNYEKNGWYTVM